MTKLKKESNLNKSKVELQIELCENIVKNNSTCFLVLYSKYCSFYNIGNNEIYNNNNNHCDLIRKRWI